MVIKIGGSFLKEPSNLYLLCNELKLLASPYVIIHGGGERITDFSKKLGYTTQFNQGVRLTTAELMPLIDMILSGEINTSLVRIFRKNKIPAVGLTGADGLITGTPLHEQSRTGYATTCNTTLIHVLWQKGYIPIIASVASDTQYHALNINADTMAQACALALQSNVLVSLSDVSGIYNNNTLLRTLHAKDIETLIDRKTIRGGMIVKLRSMKELVLKGINSIHIGTIKKKGDLHLLLQGEIGTRVH